MARRLDPKGQSLYARFLRYLSEGDDRLDREVMRAVDAPPAQPAAETVKAPELPARVPEAVVRRHTRAARIFYLVAAALMAAGISLLLILTTTDLPSFGDDGNPVNNEVVRRYLEDGMRETGSVNLVTGMILDYRAFDTLGESNVLFTAACAVMILLRAGNREERIEIEADERMENRNQDPILQTVTRLLVPLILMFGCYVIPNGHLSPGGGFSGGAVLGAAMILYLNAFGSGSAGRFMTLAVHRAVTVTALSFYALSKAYSFFTGANHLPSVITPGTPGNLFSAGLIPYLNICVGLVVCFTMYAFFALFRKGDI